MEDSEIEPMEIEEQKKKEDAVRDIQKETPKSFNKKKKNKKERKSLKRLRQAVQKEKSRLERKETKKKLL